MIKNLCFSHLHLLLLTFLYKLINPLFYYFTCSSPYRCVSNLTCIGICDPLWSKISLGIIHCSLLLHCSHICKLDKTPAPSHSGYTVHQTIVDPRRKVWAAVLSNQKQAIIPRDLFLTNHKVSSDSGYNICGR
jgi:hypothetical protein